MGRYRDNMGNARFGLSELPKGKVAATVTGGGNMAMFSSCPDKKAGWAVLSWLNSTQVNKRWALSTGSIPVRQSVLATPEYSDYLMSDPKGNAINAGWAPHLDLEPLAPARFVEFLRTRTTQ